MDRETLLQAIEHGPVRVTMNVGLYGKSRTVVSSLIEFPRTQASLVHSYPGSSRASTVLQAPPP